MIIFDELKSTEEIINISIPGKVSMSFSSSVNSPYHSCNSSQANINYANQPTLPGFTANMCDCTILT